jgi:hypothetical protein
MGSLVVSANYYYGCEGGCKGCQLTPSERNSSTANFNKQRLLGSLHSVLKTTKEIDFFSFVLGKGNILELDEAESLVAEVQSEIEDNLQYKEAIIEVNTSLVGSYLQQKEKAFTIAENALRLELRGSVKTRFTVVYDLTCSAPEYKQSVIDFLESLAALRSTYGVKDYYDTLQVILPINHTFQPKKLVDFFSFHKGAFNLAWGRFNGLSGSRLSQAQNWLVEFSRAAKGRLDLNFNNAIENIPNINEQDSMLQAITSMKSVLFILDNGEVALGDFTPFGEFDTQALLQSNTPPMLAESALKIERKRFLRNLKCLSCSYQDMCLSTGGHKLALYNTKHNPSIHSLDCPSLLKPFFHSLSNE